VSYFSCQCLIGTKFPNYSCESHYRILDLIDKWCCRLSGKKLIPQQLWRIQCRCCILQLLRTPASSTCREKRQLYQDLVEDAPTMTSLYYPRMFQSPQGLGLLAGYLTCSTVDTPELWSKQRSSEFPMHCCRLAAGCYAELPTLPTLYNHHIVAVSCVGSHQLL